MAPGPPPADVRARLAPWLLLALAATALLAVGLPELELGPGLPLPAIDGGSGAGAAAELDSGVPVSLGALARALLAALAAALALWAAWQALRGLRAGALAAALAKGVALLFAAGAALGLLALLPHTPGTAPLDPPLPLPSPAPRSPLGAPPGWLALLVAVALPLCAGLGIAFLLLPARRARGALRRVGLEAARARDALLAGGDARGIIVACYARMSAVVAEARGIERGGATTAREYERVLGALGLPGAALHGLTAAFEAARYGEDQPAATDVATALSCLERIVAHCAARRGAR